MKKASIHVAAIARNPSTTMTAIAQRGKEEEEEAYWTSPDVEGLAAAEREAERDESEAARREEEEADAREADAREAEEEAAATESSTVVCTAVNMG